jgi:hypothetical protein
MNRPDLSTSSRRSTLLTVSAVGGALLAGGVAVAANIGILNAADDDAIGQLSAAYEASPTSLEPQVIDVYLEEPTAPTLPPVTTVSTLPAGTVPSASAPRAFAVENAGTVSVSDIDGVLSIAEVVAADGWMWDVSQPDDHSVSVTFASNDTTYVFVAEIGPAGDLVARVDQPIVQVVQVPNTSSTATVPNSAPGTVPRYDDDDHEDHDDDHDEYEAHDDDHEDHDDDDHDDDHDEREGGDDDD